jgi:hypothetical protein
MFAHCFPRKNKKPAGTEFGRVWKKIVCLALAAFVKRPQSELKSALI